MSSLAWSDRPTRREATRGADAPGIVRLLSNEPTETERYGHAFGLMVLVARAEARERELQGRRDSNPRPTVLETAALPTELRP
jgi:hypothetical protein